VEKGKHSSRKLETSEHSNQMSGWVTAEYYSQMTEWVANSPLKIF
jgi:hypothetical protein